jgi:hypothetical protein
MRGIAASAFRLRRERPGVRAHDRHQPTTFEIRDCIRQRSIAGVFDRPTTCAYADMNRLKSNDAIPRREFGPRDPCRTNQR